MRILGTSKTGIVALAALAPLLAGCNVGGGAGSVGFSSTGSSQSSVSPSTSPSPSLSPTPSPSPSPSASPTPSPSASVPAPSASATSGTATWHEATQLAANADLGQLYYSPLNQAYVTYATIFNSNEYANLIYQSNGTFGAPVQVFEGTPESLYFKSSTDLLFNINSLETTGILENTNSGTYGGGLGSGTGWNWVTGYADLGNQVPIGEMSTLSSVLASVNGDISLFFGYYSRGPFGFTAVGVVATQSNGVWPAVDSDILPTTPVSNVNSVLSFGTDVLLNGSKLSTDSGSSWNSGIGASFMRSADNAVFASNASAPGWSVSASTGLSSDLGELVLDDSDSFVANITSTAVAAVGNTIVAIAVVNENEIYSMVSYDNGATWNLPSKILDISNGSNIISKVSLAAMTGAGTHIGMAYSEEDGSGDYEGVNFMEFF